MENIHSEPTRVYLVEDSIPIRKRLAGLLGEITGVQLVGEADTAASAAAGILQTRPNVVVLDIRLAQGTGIDVLRQVHPQAPEIVFIVLTTFASPQYKKTCMDAGASYFLDKSAEMSEVKRLVSAFAATRH
jgi:DNA-binding NarL/FixJ family response regulator